MIPSIEEIVRAVKAGTMGFNEACNLLEEHCKLSASVAADQMAEQELRDHFAAMALSVAAADELRHPIYDEATYKGSTERAYLYADAMLEARK